MSTIAPAIKEERVGAGGSASPERRRRMLAAAFLVVLSFAQDPAATDAEPTVDLVARVATARERAGVPAFAAALVSSAGVRVAHAGVRRHGGEDALVPGDRFHLGSVTKAMTATLLGTLVADGTLEWGTTVGSALGIESVREEYRDVTLAQLVRHRGGFAAHTSADATSRPAGTTPRRRRAAFAARLLDEAPAGPVGAYRYSNAGYAVAVAIAERATDTSFEQLLRERVFTPLGMGTAEVGWPASRDRPEQPRGHWKRFGWTLAQPLSVDHVGDHLAPGAGVCCSIEDLAKFARFHLAALRGAEDAGPLGAAAVAELHRVESGETSAAGWQRLDRDGRELHGRDGTAGSFYVVVRLDPARDVAVVAAANVGPPCAAAVRAFVDELLDAAAAAMEDGGGDGGDESKKR